MNEMAAWNCARNRPLYKKKGNRAHIGRYGSVTTEGLKLVKNWNGFLFESTVPSAEGGRLNKQSITRVKLRCNGADDASQLGSGTSSLQEADRTLMSCGDHSMVCCMATRFDFRNKRILAVIAHVLKFVMDWADKSN